MKKTIAIFILLPLCAFSNFLEKKIDAYIKKKTKAYLRNLKIERVEYIFPNKLNLIGISYSKSGFSFEGNGLLEVNISISEKMEPIFSPKIILNNPQFSIGRDFLKKGEKIPLPHIEVIVKNGKGNIKGLTLCDNVSGYIKNKRFSFTGFVFGAQGSISGEEGKWIAQINDCKISLLPYLPNIKKGGFADITLKKEKETEIIVDIKNGVINITDRNKLKKINGRIQFKERTSKGKITFLYDMLSGKITFNEKMGLYNIMGNFYYNKINLPFSIEGLFENKEKRTKSDVFRIIKGNIKNTSISGIIGKEISLSLSFNNEDNILVLINPLFYDVILNGSGTITGTFKNIKTGGTFTLTKDNNVLPFSIYSDNNIVSIKTGTISLSGIDLASSLIGTISLKPFFISGNIINPFLFDDGKIEGAENTLEISLLSEKRRLFVKKDGLKIMFKYLDIIKGFPLDCYGRIVPQKERLKLIIEYGKIREIPINKGLVNIEVKNNKILVEDLELLIDEITSIRSSFEITKDKIELPILITQIKTEHIYKNLSLRVDFKGRIVGDIKKPTIFGELYSQESKLMADIIMSENSLLLKNGRLGDTTFNLSISIPTGSISGFAELKNEEFGRETIFPPIFPISGRANGGAIFSGSLYNPEITGSITVLTPLLFGVLQGNSMNMRFEVFDKTFSSSGSITSDDGSLSFKTKITYPNIETEGNISHFKIAELPIIGSFSFKGLYKEKTMEGVFSLKDIEVSGYRIPDILEVVTYEKGQGLNLTGPISGMVANRQTDLLLSLKDFKIGPSKITGTITACGEIENPEINGEIEIIGSNLTLPIFAEPLNEVNCKIKIDEGIIKILRFKGETKKTKIVLKHIKENLFEVKTEGEPIKINIPGIIKGEAQCELMVEYLERTFKSKGKITISNARFTYPPTKRKGIPFLEQFIYGVRIEAGHNVWFYNEFCEVEIENGGFLNLKKIDNTIKPEGSCRSKKGRVSYLGTNFTISESNFEFRDGIPYLVGYADWTKDNISLTISHTGMLSLPIELRLFSKTHPGKTHDELVRILEEKGEKPTGFVAGIVSERIVEQVTRSIRHWANLDLEVIIPFPEVIFSGTQTYTYGLVGTEVKIGRYLKEGLYLIYEGKVEGYEEERYKYRHKIGFEYDIGRNIGFKYLYTPEGGKRKKEHKISIKKSIDF